MEHAGVAKNNLDGDAEAGGVVLPPRGGQDVLAGAAKVEVAPVKGCEVRVAPGHAGRRARPALATVPAASLAGTKGDF